MDVATNLEEYRSANHHKHTTSNWLYRWHLRVFHEAIYELLKQAEPETVLDAGCGEGFVIDFLRKKDPSLRFTGVDADEGAIAYAKAMLDEDVRLRTGNVYKLPFSDSSFDAVLCSEVLEHLDDPVKAVEEIKRVTRRYAVITVPREPYFRLLNDMGQALGLSPDPGHVNFWTHRSFQDFINGRFSKATFMVKHVFQLALAEV